ncbi:MAG TPA: AarF/ABC1/UbiB kinase family protein [Acidimicrobiia bacterium]|nr:AarF/ABC1/UbiB kinase family protein [Acidimicrobiia bacterium]
MGILVAVLLTIVALGVLAVAVVTALAVRRSGWRVLRTRLQRSTRIWRLAARRSLRFLHLRRRATQDQIDEFHLQTAEEVFELMGGMKGAVMKLGQMVSILGDTLPGAYSQALQGLQSQAPPMAYDLMATVVEEELGAPPEVVFRTFTTEPVAAASIGQVHRAVLDDGTEVAVKVQYPGVDVAIRADLDNAFLLTNVARMMAPGIEPEPLVEELRKVIGDELDYRKEAANQEEFRRAYEGHPWVRIPSVLPEFSGRRVITSEWVSGRSFYDFLDAPQDVRDEVGEKLFRFFVGSVGVLRFFNADPHPGNYFFGDDGTVTFLDFGMVKRFSPEVMESLCAQIDALRAGDQERLRDAMVHHGWFKPAAPIDLDRLSALAHLTQQPLVGRGPYTYTSDYMREVVEAAMSLQGPYADVIKHMTVPPDHMMLNRIQLGVGALLGRLRATGPWGAIFDEYLFGAAPATPLGAAAAGWPRVQPDLAGEISG